MPRVFNTFSDALAPAIVDIWNTAMVDEHGFFPLTPERLRTHYYSSKRFKPEYVVILTDGDANIGFVHYDVVDVPGYDRAGVICALAVHPNYQRQGIGNKLLGKAVHDLDLHNRLKFIDAAGAWPYSSFFATLIDGSERAGINNTNKAGTWLFDQYYFYPGRTSYRMTKNLDTSALYSMLPQHIYNTSRKGKTTWLDHAFRDWELFDHELLSKEGDILSRCIYARMNGVSDYSGRECYSVFGVGTPAMYQGMGYATANLRLLSNMLKAEGANEIELHVYQDNIPAVKLYQRVGFEITSETAIMRRY